MRTLRRHGYIETKAVAGGVKIRITKAKEFPQTGRNARACENIADFECIGRRALRRPEWKGRLKLFETYFVGDVECRRAVRQVGVAPGTFDYWFREVKRALSAEFSRTGLFPPARCFQS
jgi:hypothetical protein